MSKQENNTKNSGQLNRREMLGGAGTVVTLGTVAAALGACAPAETPVTEEDLVGTSCVTVLYPNGDDITFDFEYYRDSHMTLIMDLYGSSIREFILRKGLPGPDGSAPPYVATITIGIADLEAFAAAGAQHTQTLIDDVPNFTNGLPIFQTDEVFAISKS